MTESNDQPIQNSHGLDEAMKTILGVERALAERGLTCHSGSALGSLFAKVRRLADDTKRPLSDEKRRRTFLKANEALRIARAVNEALDDDGAKEAIHRVRTSDMNLDTRQNVNGKDALWELDLHRRFKLGQTPVRIEEPDLVISLGETFGDYSLACKKIYSENNVAHHFDLGCDQISRHGRPGIVAFNLDDIVPEGEAWEFPTERELRQKLNAMNQDFILSNEIHFRSAIARGACDGVLVSTSVISNVLDMTPAVNVTHSTASWFHGARPEAQTRFKTFLKCLDGVLRSGADAE
ncbi:hypothetical protein [Paraburkholderia sp. C35]|uniref:hypothetical protein n=1 Tax=Paraburkholderia sp. C35 TaxID=2126993 RepID=UPI000D693BD2|nr:hypothetical protein [Paraburkholderia sp. C35]